MQLYKARGGTKEALEAKEYNLGVGISLGNKWFTVPNIIELIRFSLAYTRRDVIVYVADSIHAINLEVRKRIKYEKALKIAENMGKDLLRLVEKEVKNTFSPSEIEKVHYVNWNEIASDLYKRKVDYLYNLYNTNPDFKNYLQDIVKGYLSKETSPRTFAEEEVNRLAMYIIEELPEQMCRIPLGKYECDAFVYPYDGTIVELSEKIQNGEIFPEIKENILDTKPKVFLEVR